MPDWRVITLEDGLERLIDYRGKSPPKSPFGIPVISAKVVKDGRITRPIEQKIDPSYYPVWMTRGLPSVGDVVMTTEGPLGEVAQLDEESVKYALGQRVICMRGKKGLLDSTFLRFLLGSRIQQGILASFATGTTVAGISQKAFRTMPIRIPTYRQQVAIGEVLSALDHKIDLNRRMNETLETMARAIFKDWFVDFAPTRAKGEGRAPYLSPDVWSLFPARLDDEGKPEGWQLGKLEDIGQNLTRTCQPHEIEPGTPYIALEHMPRRQVALNEWSVADEVESGKIRFRRGDFLFGKLRPYFHKVGVAPVDGVCTTDAVVVAAKRPTWSSFVLMVISSDEFVAFTDQRSTGTKMPRTSWREMGRFGLMLPNEPAAAAFEAKTLPLVGRMLSNIMESRTLAATRDLLLPKLMSGEIRIKDAERVLEAVL